MKKQAFTMLEVVFVIVVIGILSVVFIPRFGNNNLSQAANQLISHIRYTQHLALIDDKYDPNDPLWFLERWTIRLKQNLVYTGGYTPNGTYTNVWAYTVYSDTSHDGNPNLSEMAKNPNNTNQYMSGGYNNILHKNNNTSMDELRLGEKYGIVDITFGGGCRSNVTYVSFDHLGRPFNSFPASSPYELPSAGFHKLLTSRCDITLCTTNCSVASTSEKIVIGIEPETGYVHLL
jgi:prepilin-type N-terminal cleavage/methylation domain-containing protein